MKPFQVQKSMRSLLESGPRISASRDSAGWTGRSESASSDRHPVYLAVRHTVRALLIVAVLLSLYSLGWEFSTRRYLRGFSDAIVPATAPADEKIEAILNWMDNGPARLKNSPNTLDHDRDPMNTLNSDALLKVCGTATNAFINLVDSGGLSARRLLLLDKNQMTKHVTAEVLVDGRWIVVDPAYRVVFRDPDGSTLTREQLADPAVFSAATRDIRGFDPAYTFEHIAHVRVMRLKIVGSLLGFVLDHLLPRWDDSATMTLLMERNSFAMMAVSVFLLAILMIFRAALQWYGERYLQVRGARMRDSIRRAAQAFLDAT